MGKDACEREGLWGVFENVHVRKNCEKGKKEWVDVSKDGTERKESGSKRNTQGRTK